jgi:4-amino-4-deoxy-L-arabinose transferase-like glycosyltransferase
MATFRQTLGKQREIALILAGFLVLGALYASVNPIFEAPDEIQHYFYVKHIADGKGLPVVRNGSQQIYKREGGQPPLYYLLGALATFRVDTSDAQLLLNPNPYVTLGIASQEGNKNVILHTEREGFPYKGTTLAVHLLRYLSLSFGATTVLATYLLSLQVLPGQKATALGAAAITAFNPKFIFTNAAVNNDGLLIALCSLALLMAVGLLRRGPSLRGYIGLGLIVGLAVLTKLTALGLLVLVLYALAVLGVRYSAKEAATGATVVLGLVILLAGWWFVRNLVLYHEPTGMNLFFTSPGQTPNPIPLSTILGDSRRIGMTYWAVFGWLNVLASSWVYRFFDLLVVLGIVGLPLALVRGLRKPCTVPGSFLLLLILWVVVVALGYLAYVRYNLVQSAGTGRMVLPAVSCISILMSWGLTQLPPRRWRMPLVAVMAVAMALVALACPFLYIVPAYARPAPLSAEQLESVPNPVDVEYGAQMRLLGYEVKGDTVRPGETIQLVLCWQAVTAMDRDYSVSLVVLTPDGELIGQWDSYPGLGNFPTSAWQAGEAIRDRLWVQIRPGTPTPTIAWLAVNVYYLPTMERLDSYKSGHPVEQVFLQPIKIVPWRTRQYEISHPVTFNFGDEIDLIGYDLETSQARPGGVVSLTLYWEARREVGRDYTVFTHLIDSDDQMWAQKDNPPRGGNYPTSFWDQGELIRDDYDLPLPSDTPLGEYVVEIGLYLPPTGERLPVLDYAGQVVDDRVLLDTIAVTG